MNIFKHIKMRRKERDFRTNIIQTAQKHNLDILGEISENEHFHDKHITFGLRLGVNGQIYSALIEYNHYRNYWWTPKIIGNGFEHVFNYEYLGKTIDEIVINLQKIAQMLSIGLFDIYATNPFSLVIRRKKNYETIGVGIQNGSKVYYLFLSDVTRMNLPLDLVTSANKIVECFKSDSGYISEWEYEKKVQPIKITDDIKLALKILLTVREWHRKFDD